jgi:hypothetical protein
VLGGVVVGWTAALLVTRAGRRPIAWLVALLSRFSDPALAPLWRIGGPRRA